MSIFFRSINRFPRVVQMQWLQLHLVVGIHPSLGTLLSTCHKCSCVHWSFFDRCSQTSSHETSEAPWLWPKGVGSAGRCEALWKDGRILRATRPSWVAGWPRGETMGIWKTSSHAQLNPMAQPKTSTVFVSIPAKRIAHHSCTVLTSFDIHSAFFQARHEVKEEVAEKLKRD